MGDELTLEDVTRFVDSKKKANTVLATRRDVANFQSWLATSKFELRPMEYLDPDELNQYICLYLMSIKKLNGEQFEPSSLV